jgi:hypothetical protein
MFIWVRLRDHPTTTKYINEDTFDKESMEKLTSEEMNDITAQGALNIKDILSSRSAPGMFLKDKSSRASTNYKGKLDSGATEDLIDRGLEGAKKRALERNKNKGSAFRKVKNRKLKKIRRKS